MAVSEEECSSAKSGPSSSSSASRYYLSKCVLRGSVVLQVLYAHIRSPSSNDIIFGKETSIELVVIEDDGNVQSVCDQPVFGTIKDLAILPWNEKFRARDPQFVRKPLYLPVSESMMLFLVVSGLLLYAELWGKDLLVATSDSGKLSLLTFCNEMHRFACPVFVSSLFHWIGIRSYGRGFPVSMSIPGNPLDLPGRRLAVDSR
ncbi:hypothetical protein V8G54_021069 [Vigna mungo]|uniref:RSE1/DDB1/CPSF1 first beta-propeller domain-containing protein n=1 Tax=Vigna mungo TaxID=3915 RepID=A0AAQ3NFH3_VIGMU